MGQKEHNEVRQGMEVRRMASLKVTIAVVVVIVTMLNFEFKTLVDTSW